MRHGPFVTIAAIAAGALFLGASGCAALAENDSDSDTAVIAVTTSILGDVVTNVVGEQADVLVLTPAGADPHSYQLSTREVGALHTADLIVANGLGLEQSLAAHIAGAESDGVPVISVGEEVSPLLNQSSDDDHDGHDDAHNHGAHSDDDDGDGDHGHEHGDEAHHGHDDGSGHDHNHGRYDPHFWHDPQRMVLAVDAIEAALLEHTDLDADELRAGADDYRAELQTLDAELAELFAEIPHENRLLVTQHRVLAYLADRYDFTEVASIIPNTSTLAEASAAEVVAVADRMTEAGARAIFTDASGTDQLAKVVASESALEVQVVALHTESLTPQGGTSDTYLDLMRSNAAAIADALG